jgi:hypothetical protein
MNFETLCRPISDDDLLDELDYLQRRVDDLWAGRAYTKAEGLEARLNEFDAEARRRGLERLPRW